MEKGAETLLAWSPLVEAKGRLHLHVRARGSGSPRATGQRRPRPQCICLPTPTSSRAFGLLDERWPAPLEKERKEGRKTDWCWGRGGVGNGLDFVCVFVGFIFVCVRVCVCFSIFL